MTKEIKKTVAVCDNCGARCFPDDEGGIGGIDNLAERLEEGGEVPACQCPECGALAYLEKADDSRLSEREFHLLVVQVDILRERPFVDDYDLSTLAYDITEGSASGRVKEVSRKVLTAPEAAKLALDQDSDPAFFGLGEGGEELFRSAQEGEKMTTADKAFERYEIRPGGTVYDHRTGLEWESAKTVKARKRIPWQAAMDAAEAKGDGWRLPTVDELVAVVDWGRVEPATDLPGMVSDGYWSSSSYAAGSSYAWRVAFNAGYVYYDDKTFTTSARCVRLRPVDPGYLKPTRSSR